MQMFEKRCKLFIPCDAHRLTRFLGGLIMMLDESLPNENEGKRKASLSINQNAGDEKAEFHFVYEKSGTEEHFLNMYESDKRFSFDRSGYIKFDASEVLMFTPQWVDAYNAEEVIVQTFLECCPSARLLSASHSSDTQTKLFCSFVFEISE